MLAQQENNCLRHKGVPVCLVEHEAAYADIPALMNVRNTYEKKIADVARLAMDRDTVDAGTADDKNALRVIPQHETMFTAGILSDQARGDTGDPE